MILKTTVGELLEAIDNVWETTDAKKSVISSKILMKGVSETCDSWLYLYSTDYGTQCLSKTEVELDEDFNITVDPDDLTKGIRSLNHETALKIDFKTQRLVAGKIRYKVNVSDQIEALASSMKQIPVIKDCSSSVNPICMSTGIKAVSFAVSKNKSLYGVVRSMEIKGSENKILFAATDGSVAAICEISKGEVKDFSFNMSQEHSQVFKKLLDMNKAGNVEISTSEGNRIYFKFPSILFGAAKSTGKLPDIRKLLNSYKPEASGKVNAKELKQALNRAALFIATNGEHASGISLSTQKDKLSISTVDFEETIEGEFNNNSSVVIKKDFLIECLASCMGETTELVIPEKEQALIIKDNFTAEDMAVTSSYILMGMSK